MDERLGKHFDIPLMEAAVKAAENTYSPYSNFPVGAAVLSGSGIIYPGTNIENASYGLTMCGDRAAIINARSSGETEILAMAISCPDAPIDDENFHPNFMMPCGACRQVMVEHMREDAPIIIQHVGWFTIGQLLPMPFKLR